MKAQAIRGVTAASSILFASLLGAGLPADAAAPPANASSVTLSVIHNFSSGTDGAYPQGLTVGSDGRLYGSTTNGGLSNIGTIYSVTTAGAYSELQTFLGLPASAIPAGLLFGAPTGPLGQNPTPTLAAGSLVYFTAQTVILRGSSYANTLYEFSPLLPYLSLPKCNWEDNMHSFTGNLAAGGDGSVYASSTEDFETMQDSGVVVKINPQNQLSIMHAFPLDARDGTGNTGGAYPAGLMQASDGSVYGVTQEGGAGDFGTIYRITSAGTFSTLHVFNGADGREPTEAPVQAADGNLYGVAEGGPNDYGVIYRIVPKTGAFSVVATFANNLPGPDALVAASDGNIYGTLYGPSVFRMTLPGYAITVFPRDDHNSLLEGISAPMTMGPDGNFYGTTFGSPIGEPVTPTYGQVFKLTVH